MASNVVIDGTPTNGANPLLDSLVSGYRWGDGDGGVVTITVAAVYGGNPFYGMGGVADMFTSGAEWFDYELDAAIGALSAWEAVANIDVVEATSLEEADIWYYNTFQLPSDVLGAHDFPNVGIPSIGVFNWTTEAWGELQPGGYGFFTLLHEFGHGLGLAHPHDGGADPEGSLFPGVTSPTDTGDNDLNQGIWTAMSYVPGYSTYLPSTISYGMSATPMALDIAAIQLMYGANMTYRTGADVYTLPTANAEGTFWACIWDAGGTDLITNQGSSISAYIDLRPAPLVGETLAATCRARRASSVDSPLRRGS